MAELRGPGRQVLVLHGIAWGALYQVFQTAVSFGAMLVLVRLIPPAEYGRIGVVLGFLTLLNAGGCGMFLAQALQLDDRAEPDWSLHWSASFYIQTVLSATCHLLAGLCWFVTAYRPIAPLLHLAALGLLLDWPNRFGATMLKRRLELRRLQMIYGAGVFASMAVTLVVAYGGGGAYAIVLGSNVVLSLPFTIDLLFVRGWRPGPGWWRWPDWNAYRPALRFGFQQMASALLASVRGALESLVLPHAVGYVAIGLLNRAQALFNGTVGRAGSVLIETVYPLLPRSRDNAERYARRGMLFAQAFLLVAVPGGVYVGLEGRALLRILYGERWISADLLIWPASAAGVGFACFALCLAILLGANRLRRCLAMDFVSAVVSVPVVAVAWLGGGIKAYAWAVACGQVVAAAIALRAVSPLLPRGWARAALLPPALSSLLAVGAVLGIESAWELTLTMRGLMVGTGVYALSLGLVLRGLFPSALAALLSRLPSGERLLGWLRIPAAAVTVPS